MWLWPYLTSLHRHLIIGTSPLVKAGRILDLQRRKTIVVDQKLHYLIQRLTEIRYRCRSLWMNLDHQRCQVYRCTCLARGYQEDWVQETKARSETYVTSTLWESGLWFLMEIEKPRLLKVARNNARIPHRIDCPVMILLKKESIMPLPLQISLGSGQKSCWYLKPKLWVIWYWHITVENTFSNKLYMFCFNRQGIMQQTSWQVVYSSIWQWLVCRVLLRQAFHFVDLRSHWLSLLCISTFTRRSRSGAK